MGIILELEESDFAGYIPDGTIYAAQVVNVSLKERPARNHGEEPIRRIEFRFKLISDDAHDGRDIWGSTSTKFVNHPNCKLYAWTEALLGRKLPTRYKLDTDDLVDRRCRVIISHRTWESNGETKERNEVREVMPTKEAMAALAAAGEDDVF